MSRDESKEWDYTLVCLADACQKDTLDHVDGDPTSGFVRGFMQCPRRCPARTHREIETTEPRVWGQIRKHMFDDATVWSMALFIHQYVRSVDGIDRCLQTTREATFASFDMYYSFVQDLYQHMWNMGYADAMEGVMVNIVNDRLRLVMPSESELASYLPSFPAALVRLLYSYAQDLFIPGDYFEVYGRKYFWDGLRWGYAAQLPTSEYVGSLGARLGIPSTLDWAREDSPRGLAYFHDFSKPSWVGITPGFAEALRHTREQAVPAGTLPSRQLSRTNPIVNSMTDGRMVDVLRPNGTLCCRLIALFSRVRGCKTACRALDIVCSNLINTRENSDHPMAVLLLCIARDPLVFAFDAENIADAPSVLPSPPLDEEAHFARKVQPCRLIDFHPELLHCPFIPASFKRYPMSITRGPYLSNPERYPVNISYRVAMFHVRSIRNHLQYWMWLVPETTGEFLSTGVGFSNTYQLPIFTRRMCLTLYDLFGWWQSCHVGVPVEMQHCVVLNVDLTMVEEGEHPVVAFCTQKNLTDIKRADGTAGWVRLDESVSDSLKSCTYSRVAFAMLLRAIALRFTGDDTIDKNLSPTLPLFPNPSLIFK